MLEQVLRKVKTSTGELNEDARNQRTSHASNEAAASTILCGGLALHISHSGGCLINAHLFLLTCNVLCVLYVFSQPTTQSVALFEKSHGGVQSCAVLPLVENIRGQRLFRAHKSLHMTYDSRQSFKEMEDNQKDKCDRPPV